MKDEQWAPDRIWLQRGVGDYDTHTWHTDSLDDSEIEEVKYVRAALVTVEASAEPVAKITAADEYGPMLEWSTHWVELIGKSLYTYPASETDNWQAALVTTEAGEEATKPKTITDERMRACYRQYCNIGPEAEIVESYFRRFDKAVRTLLSYVGLEGGES